MLSDDITGLLRFLPERENSPFEKGEFHPEHGSYDYPKRLRAFRNACHDFCAHFSFDWVSEIKEIQKWNIEEATLLQLGRLLYAILRQDRFVENNFYVFVISEESLSFLRRLKQVATPKAIDEIQNQTE